MGKRLLFLVPTEGMSLEEMQQAARVAMAKYFAAAEKARKESPADESPAEEPGGGPQP